MATDKTNTLQPSPAVLVLWNELVSRLKNSQIVDRLTGDASCSFSTDGASSAVLVSTPAHRRNIQLRLEITPSEKCIRALSGDVELARYRYAEGNDSAVLLTHTGTPANFEDITRNITMQFCSL